MSLLMDALKKAELAKRQGHADGVTPAGAESMQDGLALEPLATSSIQPPAGPSATGSSAADKFPDLPSHLEELDAQFLEEAAQAASTRLKVTQPPAREPAAAPPAPAEPVGPGGNTVKRSNLAEQDSPRRTDAQNLFAAKHTDKTPARKPFAIAIGVFTVLAVCGIGGYFWWQLQPKNVPLASRAPAAPTSIASPATAPAPAAMMPPPAPAAAVIAAPPGALAPTRAAMQRATDDEDGPAPFTLKGQGQRSTPLQSSSTDPDSPVRITRSPLKVNPALLRGFDAFNRGDLVLAQLEYERAQKSDPRNTDVLHGLAAIAMRQGRLDQAEWLYRQITEADPQDTVAQAALINAHAQSDPSAAESRLKSMSAAQPELAAPHFSLGNLYARQGRWNEAQQAYFRAYTSESDNPDILYNLAVSLEHLRQNKLAAQYYSQALTAAQSKPAGFDKAQAAARLAALQQ